jgi:hypothetical protein
MNFVIASVYATIGDIRVHHYFFSKMYIHWLISKMSLETRLTRRGLKFSNDVHSNGHIRYGTLKSLLVQFKLPFDFIQCDNEEKCTIPLLKIDLLLNFASLLVCKTSDIGLIQGNCTIEQSVCFFIRILDLLDTQPPSDDEIVRYEKFVHGMVENHESKAPTLKLFSSDVQHSMLDEHVTLEDLNQMIINLERSTKEIMSQIPSDPTFDPHLSPDFQKSLVTFSQSIQQFTDAYKNELVVKNGNLDSKLYGIGPKAQDLFSKVESLKQFAENINSINECIQTLLKSSPTMKFSPEIFEIFDKHAKTLSKFK